MSSDSPSHVTSTPEVSEPNLNSMLLKGQKYDFPLKFSTQTNNAANDLKFTVLVDGYPNYLPEFFENFPVVLCCVYSII